MKAHIEYDMQPIEDVSFGPETGFERVALAAGSDPRAYEILRRCSKLGVGIEKVLVFDYRERRESLPLGGEQAYDEFKKLGFPFDVIECSIRDPSACIKSLKGISILNSDRIAVDISCFTKPYFYSLLKYLKDQGKAHSVTVLYTEPTSYVFRRGSYKEYRSSIGPLSVIEVPGFPGLDTGTNTKLLVVLLGFDGDLSIVISEEVAPDEMLFVNGFPGYAPKFKDISLMNNEKILGNHSLDSIRYARANNPFETFDLLQEIGRQNGSAFISVAPLGTKPMALGACLYAMLNKRVRVVYPLPDEYTNVTTYECWRSWQYTIPFDLGGGA